MKEQLDWTRQVDSESPFTCNIQDTVRDLFRELLGSYSLGTAPLRLFPAGVSIVVWAHYSTVCFA